MLKSNLFIICLLIVASLQSQNLEQYISKDAKAVIEVDGGQIFSLIDAKDLQMLMPPSPDGAPLDLEQYGINVKSKAYYFYNEKESLGYQNFVIGLSDAQKAEEFISSMLPTEPTTVNGFSFAMESNMTAAWNNNMAILTYVDFPKKEYTMEDLLAEKEEERLAKEAEESDEAQEMVEDEYAEEDAYEEVENLEFELMLKNMDAPSLYSEDDMAYMLTENFTSILNTPSTQSITQESSYVKGKKKNASAYFWLNDLDELVNDAIPEELTSMIPGGGFGSQAIPTGMESITSNLIFNEDEIRWESNFGLDPRIGESYAKIYGGKMDKSFLNHFDENDVLSYISFSTDMAKTLEEYPEIMQTLYGSYFPDFFDEIGIAMDLMEVILDEEAIGELITGDALMLLHNVEEREVTYTTTEYDEDLNATEVEKTKKEPLPIFSVMLGSENKKIVSKIMRLSSKYHVADAKSNHYHISSEAIGAPFDMYFTQNDGIVYLTNSPTKVNNYANGKKTRNPGKHKKLLRKNAFNLYMNTTSIMDNVSDMIPLDSQTLNYAKSNYKEMYMTSSKVEDNKLNVDFVIKTSGAQGNSLKLILDSMNTTMKGI